QCRRRYQRRGTERAIFLIEKYQQRVGCSSRRFECEYKICKPIPIQICSNSIKYSITYKIEGANSLQIAEWIELRCKIALAVIQIKLHVQYVVQNKDIL